MSRPGVESLTTVGYVRFAVWWIDVLAWAAMVAVWIFIPRWAALTSAFYRRRGADFGDGRPVIVVFRAAFLLIAISVVVDLTRRTAHRL